MILRTLVVTSLATNCYVIGCLQTREGAVIDPGGNAPGILETVQEAGLSIKYVINTHGHIDHIGANKDVLQATGASLVVHKQEASLLTSPAKNLGMMVGRFSTSPDADLLVEEGDILSIGNIRLEVLHTPGHTPGSISLYDAEDGLVFSGDALFRGSIGRTDFPGGDYALLIESIRDKLLILPEDTTIYPGHGPETTVGYEKRSNPWLQQRTR